MAIWPQRKRFRGRWRGGEVRNVAQEDAENAQAAYRVQQNYTICRHSGPPPVPHISTEHNTRQTRPARSAYLFGSQRRCPFDMHYRSGFTSYLEIEAHLFANATSAHTRSARWALLAMTQKPSRTGCIRLPNICHLFTVRRRQLRGVRTAQAGGIPPPHFRLFFSPLCFIQALIEA